jgi:hypothetical protein
MSLNIDGQQGRSMRVRLLGCVTNVRWIRVVGWVVGVVGTVVMVRRMGQVKTLPVCLRGNNSSFSSKTNDAYKENSVWCFLSMKDRLGELKVQE